MTPQEAIAELKKDQEIFLDAMCFHSDEFGSHYADGDEVSRRQEIVDTLEAFVAHHVEFVAEWFDRVPARVAHPWDANLLKEAWVEEMAGQP
jgi:hypothetical protein